MQKNNIYKWLLTAWFMLIGSTLSVVIGQQYGTPYKYTANRQVINTPIQNNSAPAYEFQSTSSYNSVVGSKYLTPMNEPFAANIKYYTPMRRSWDNPDDEEGIGEIPNPSPIGEPLVLLAMAALYLLWRQYRQHTSSAK